MIFFHVFEALDFLTQILQFGLLLVQFFDIASIEIGVLLEPLHVFADASMFRRDLGGALVQARPLGTYIVQLTA